MIDRSQLVPLAPAEQIKPEPIVGEVLVKKLCLDLGCGRNKTEGFLGVDIATDCQADVVHDLRLYPWPFDDDSVDEIRCSHFFEHIPGLDRPRFMEEVWRILKVGCYATFITPYWSSIRAVQDFSHAFPPVVAESYHYFSAVGRKAIGVEHGWYDMKCNFDVDFPHQMVDAMWAARAPEALQWAAKHYNNVIHDITARLTKRPLVKGNGAA